MGLALIQVMFKEEPRLPGPYLQRPLSGGAETEGGGIEDRMIEHTAPGETPVIASCFPGVQSRSGGANVLSPSACGGQPGGQRTFSTVRVTSRASHDQGHIDSSTASPRVRSIEIGGCAC